NREVVVRQQRFDLTLVQDRSHELAGNVAFDQTFAVLGEHRGVPHRGIQRQPDKPAVQQIVVELLHQLQLRAHRIKGLQQQRAKQPLRRNRRPAELSVELLEFRRQSRQRLVYNPPDRPQRVILWDSRLAAHIAEQRVALRIPTAHRTSPTSRHATPIVPQYLPKGRLFPDPVRFSAVHALQIFAPPLQVPGFDVALAWSPRYNNDPAVSWLRDRVQALQFD